MNELYYYPCFECRNRYGREYTEECNKQCDYARVTIIKRKLIKENKKLKELLLQHRICPECGEQMNFHIDFDFGGTLGIFNCNCGYENKNYSNYVYATKDEREKFEEATKNIMW